MTHISAVNENTRCAVVCNPRAGGLRGRLSGTRLPLFSSRRSERESAAETAQRLVREFPQDIAACVTSDRASAESFVSDAANSRVPWLIVAGGDGTLFSVVNTLYRSVPTDRWPVLSVLPTGTTNFLASLLGQPKWRTSSGLFSRLPNVERLPRLSIRMLEVGGYLCILCGAGYISGLSRAYLDRSSRIVNPYAWGVLNAIGIGTGIWYPEWLRQAHPLDVDDGDGCALRLPRGLPPAGLLCSADDRVIELWRPYFDDERSDGVHAIIAGKWLGSALRETVAAKLGRTASRTWAVARSRGRLQMKRRTWLLLDGEFVYAEPNAGLAPGPLVELADLSSISLGAE